MKEPRAESEKTVEVIGSNLLIFEDNILGHTERKEPLAPRPRSDMLTTMKAKWYQRATDNALVRATSRAIVADDIKKTPKKTL